MIKLWIILLLSLSVQTRGSSQTLTTNTIAIADKPGAVGPIFITQHGSPTRDSAQSESAASHWVVPILQLLVWPGLIAWGVWFLRKEIRGKLSSVIAVKGGQNLAVEFSSEVREQQKASASGPNTAEMSGNTEEFEKLKAQSSTSAIVTYDAKQIMEHLGKSKFAEAQKVELGALAYAALRLENYFWRVYNFIFGTQIALLQELNSRNMSEQEIHNYFEGVKSRFPAVYASWTLPGYLEFLKNFGLLQINGGEYSITEHGREFLVWLTRSQVAPSKAF